MAPSSKTFVCPVCKKIILKTQYSVKCSNCTEYFHPKCIDIDEKLLKNNKSIKYTIDRKYLRECIEAAFVAFDQRMQELVAQLRAEFIRGIKAMLADITKRKDFVTQDLYEMTRKLETMEKNNNVLQRRLNRADILINGLPRGIDNLN